MFSKAFSFKGRIKRTEYGISFIIYFALYFIVEALITGQNAMPVFGLLFFPMIWFFWAQGAKRCHDINRNGFWQIIPFYVFVLLFQKGDAWANDYDVAEHQVFYGADDYERPYSIDNDSGNAPSNVSGNEQAPTV